MSTLPAGTITFLFTDIEGSTKLWEQYPEAMKSALAKHDAILSQIVAANGGIIVKPRGDGIHAVFQTAVEGVRAALAAQRALDEESWEDLQPYKLRVRMGLHTGEAQIRAEDYYGGALNRAARLMAVGSGGQILISSTTASLVREALPDHTTLRDLGEHHLKDLVQPEHIYQIVHPSLPFDFPPIRTLDTIPNNLPVQLTSFIGRGNEIAEIQNLCETARLITLTGSGGTGKTRLALEIGTLELPNFPHGVWLIELAPLTAEPQIIPTIAMVFGLLEMLSGPLTGQVFDYLRDKRVLLILDNCEHLIEACARLANDLLHHCPQLKMIATSREALGIAGEVAYSIPSLAGAEATQLFVERARAVNPKLQWTAANAASIAQICARLDGIPLAIELAAARVKLLSPEQIAARLNDRFRLLIGGSRTALPRQQTLRALIDWSYDLLSEEEQRLVRTASVFANGWTLAAVEYVADSPQVLEHLEQLVNKSLVIAEEHEYEMRYSLLETIRQYVREKLFDAGQAAQARDRHFWYFDAFSQTAWDKSTTNEIVDWVDRILDEIENFRAALEWGLEQHPEQSLHLAANFSFILSWNGNANEARTWIQDALNRIETLPPVTGEALIRRQRLRAIALWASANAVINLGNNNAAIRDLQEAIALSRQTGDKTMLGYALQSYYLATSLVGAGDPSAAEEGLAVLLESGNHWGLAQAYLNMARIAMEHGRTTEGEQYIKKANLLEGNSPLIAGISFLGLGMTERRLGHFDAARQYFQQGLALFQKLKYKPLQTVIRSELGHIARQSGDLMDAIEIYKHTLLHWQELGSRAAIAHQLECFAFIAVSQNRLHHAAKLFGAAEALREHTNASMVESEAMEYHQFLAKLRSLLSESSFSPCWAEGRALTMDQAITLALE